MRIALTAVMMLLAQGAAAQTAVVGDAWIIGPVMVGTNTASSARVNVMASSATEASFQVSGVDLTPFLRVGKDGKIGMSTTSAANVDVNGSGDSENIALMLQSGNLYQGGTTRAQIAFGQDGTTNRRHSINSVHADSTTHNSIDFLIWSPSAGSATNLATMTVVSLVTISSLTRAAAVHVLPVGEPEVQLVVSDGSSRGAGTIHAAHQVTPSSREWKSEIEYLGAEEEATAYEREKSLGLASFRYAKMKGRNFVRNSRAPMRRGLIYEESPLMLRGKGESISMTQLLVETELAFKELARRTDALEREVAK